MKAHFNLDDKRQTGRKYEASIITSPTGCMFQRLCLMTSTCGKQMYTHQMYYGFPLPAVEEAAPTPDQPVMFEVAAVHIPVVAAVEEFERVYTDRERELQAQIAELQARLEEAHTAIDTLKRKHTSATQHIARLMEAEKARKKHIISYGNPFVDLPVLASYIDYNETRGIQGGAAIKLASDLLGDGQAGVDAFVDMVADMEIDSRDSR